MVASRNFHCVVCDKKCSGNVLRYQNQYYHKQCFELEQSEGSNNHNSSSCIKNTSDNRKQYQGQPISSSSQQRNYHATSGDQSQLSQSQMISGGNVDTNQQQQQPNYSHRHSTQQSHSSSSQKTTVASTSHNQTLRPVKNQNYHSNTDVINNMGSVRGVNRGQTLDARPTVNANATIANKQSDWSSSTSATLPRSSSSTSHLKQQQQQQPKSGNKTNGFTATTDCAGCKQKINEGQSLIALDLHWHVWCFKCIHCQTPLHGEYVAKDGRAYCEKDYQRLFGVTCVYCKRYITGKVLQAGEAHHFHPSCARCSKCGDPFVPGEEMYLQGEVTWHPRCGPGPEGSNLLDPNDMEVAANKPQLRAHSPSLSSRSRSRSASPFSYMSRQYGRSSPYGYADSEAVGDLSRIYTISYLNDDPSQGYLRRPIEPNLPKSPQFTRPYAGASAGDRSRSSSRSQYYNHSSSSHNFPRDRSVPRGLYSILSGGGGGSRTGASSTMTGGNSNHLHRSSSMMNEEPIQMAQFPSGQRPSPDSVPKIERDDFPAPPFPYHPDRSKSSNRGVSREREKSTSVSRDAGEIDGETKTTAKRDQHQQRSSRPRSRDIPIDQQLASDGDDDDDDQGSDTENPHLRKEEQELSKIANGIGKIFLQTLKEREKLRAWKRANLDPRNASRTPSATRELPNRMRYDNPTNASPSRDLDRPRHWDEDETATNGGDHSPTRTRSQLSSSYGYKVVQSNRSTPKPGYGLTLGPYDNSNARASQMSFNQQRKITQNRSTDLLNRVEATPVGQLSSSSRVSNAVHLRRSMPNVSHLHQEGPPKLYPYHLLATSNYRLPPDVDRCHLERHLSNEEFQYIFHCDRLDFYRLPEWKRNELKRRAKLF